MILHKTFQEREVEMRMKDKNNVVWGDLLEDFGDEVECA
jgi:hypothetical protein